MQKQRKRIIFSRIIIFTTDTPPDMFFQTCFNYINEKRAMINMRPLKWNNELAGEAQRWAQHLADTNHLKKNPQASKNNEGETVSWSKPVKDRCQEKETEVCYSCRQAIDSWYKERDDNDEMEMEEDSVDYQQVRAKYIISPSVKYFLV